MNILTPWSLLRKIKVWINNTFIAERGGIDFVAGSNITIAASEDAATDRVLVTISAPGGGGGLTNAYSQVTDGTNTASASGASVLRFRSPNSTINVTVSDGTPDTVDLAVGNHTHNASDITSGRLSADRLPTDSNTDRFLAVRTANASPIYTQIQASDVVSGRFALGRMPTSATANRFLVVRTANADPTYDTIQASDLPNHTHTRSQITDFAHQSTHQAGGSDALTGNLDAIARTTVRVNTGSDVGSRRRLNFIAGSNVTINATDDAANEEVDITISATGGSSGVSNAYSGIKVGATTVNATGEETVELTSSNNTINITATAGNPDTINFTVGSHSHSASDITSGRFSQARMPTSATANRFLVVRTANADPTYDVVDWTDVQNKPTSFPPSAHTHDAADITSGRLSADRLPTDSNTDRFLAVRTANASPVYTQIQASDVASGRFVLGRMPTSATANRFLVVRTANADPTYDTIQASDLPNHTHTRSQITDFAHQATHQAGGSDALTGNLDAIARTTVRVNTGTDVGSRRRLNFIAGSNITINATDDPTNEEIDITISATGGGGGSVNHAYRYIQIGSQAVTATHGESTLILESPDSSITMTPQEGLGDNDKIQLSVASTLNSNARVAVRVNTGSTVGTRRRLNFIAGPGTSIAAVDDSISEEVDITIQSGFPFDALGSIPRIIPPGVSGTNAMIVPYATNGTAATTLALTANRVYWVPFAVTHSLTITQLGINVTTSAASSTVNVGIYSNVNISGLDVPSYPGSLIGSAVSFDSATTGVKTQTVSIALSPGIYWIGLASAAAPTVRALAVGGSYSFGLASLGTAHTTHFFTTTTGGTLPSTAPTTGYSVGSTSVPAVSVLYTI